MRSKAPSPAVSEIMWPRSPLLAGTAAMSVPCGLADEDGLPAGFQILAPALADDRCYRVGAALESLLVEQWGGPLLDRAPVLEGAAS